LNVDGALSEAQRRRDELLAKYNGQLTASQKASLDRVNNLATPTLATPTPTTPTLATPTLAPAVSTKEEAVEEEDSLLSLAEEGEAEEDIFTKAEEEEDPPPFSLSRSLSPPDVGLAKGQDGAGQTAARCGQTSAECGGFGS